MALHGCAHSSLALNLPYSLEVLSFTIEGVFPGTQISEVQQAVDRTVGAVSDLIL